MISTESYYHAYRVIRDTPERLITDLKMLQREFRQNSNEEARKEYFLRIRKSYNEDTHNDVTNTAMFIFLNRTCFNGLYRVNSKGYFNCTVW